MPISGVTGRAAVASPKPQTCQIRPVPVFAHCSGGWSWYAFAAPPSPAPP